MRSMTSLFCAYVYKKEGVLKMLTMSLKIRKKNIVWMTLIALTLVGAALAVAIALSRPDADAQSPEQLLASYGWEATLQSEQQVQIPDDFPPAYEQYNALQRSQGFDLTRYAGKECTKKRYQIDNAGPDVVADLLLYQGRVIGGDIHRQIYGESPKPLSGEGL